MLTAAEWLWIIDEIKRHPKYKMLSLEDLDRIIRTGIRHEYDNVQFAINAATIFKWLSTAWENYSDRKKDEIRRNFNPSAYVEH